MALTKVKSGMRTLAADEITATEIAAGAVGASEIASTLDISSKTVTLPAASVTAHVTPTDTSILENNIALLAFQVASGDSITKFGMVDQVIDGFSDSGGVDTANSTNEIIENGYAHSVSTDNIKLLLHGNAADESQTFTDSGPNSHSMSNNSGYPQHDTGYKKFGSASIFYNGTTNQSLDVTHHADFELGSSDFAIDFWLRHTSGQGSFGAGSRNYLFGHGSNSNASNLNYGLWHYGGNLGWNCKAEGGSTHDSHSFGSAPISTNTWYHFEVSRSGNNLYVFQNGTQVGSTYELPVAFRTFENASQPFKIMSDAQDWDTNFYGHIDEFRLVKGTAGHTANFSVPTGEYTATTSVGDMTLISTSTTAESTATTADLVFLLEDYKGSHTLGTDVKAYVSRNGNADWSPALTLVDEGDWGTNKRIVTARNVSLSALAGTTNMRYKITTHSQASGTKEARIHGVSLGWS